MFRLSFYVMVLNLIVLGLLLSTFAFQVMATEMIRGTRPVSGTRKLVAQGAGLDLSRAYNLYLDRLRNKIYPLWELNEVTGKNHVVLQVTLAPDGTASDVAVTSTPTNSAAEEAASAAFNKAKPLEKLPAGSPAVRAVMTFDSTYDPHGDSSSDMGMQLKPLPKPAPKPAETTSD